MNKICLLPKNKDELNLNVDAFIIGIKNYNVLNTLEIELEELDNYLNNRNIYISLNKLFHNNELEKLNNLLKILENKKIKGVIFDDVSIYQLVKENNYNINLIWGNIHQVTSYKSINEWNKLGVKMAIISPDITLNEILEIKNNTKSQLFVPIYGKFEIFSSNRFLVQSYFDYINKNKNDNLYFIDNKLINQKYPIYEDTNGTHIINGSTMNGLEEYILLLKNDIEYVIINSFLIENIKEVVTNFKKVREMFENDEINMDKIEQLSKELGNDKVFLNKETIYKVKSDVNE